jgi:GTP-binding protein YchF
MAFSIGIVGLPNVGKSTLFKALTCQRVEIAPYPFTTINPNIGKVFVPDQRLEKIAQIVKPEKITPTTIEFIDIAGLVKGAHKGEGLGNQFLAQIRNCDAILEVIRVFKDENVEHVEKEINPKRDLEIVEIELLMKDLEIIDKILTKLEKEVKSGDKEKNKKFDLLKKVRENLVLGKKVSDLSFSEEEISLLKEFQFLTQKPIIYLFNVGENEFKFEQDLKSKVGSQYLISNLKFEEEVSELTKKEIEELKIKPFLDQLILKCYNVLNLITFFTITGGKEVRAWTIKKGALAPEAGGKVHSDFEEKFIRAEVISWQKLTEIGSWKKAKELGQVKIVGRDYIVEDGDVIEFKI